MGDFNGDGYADVVYGVSVYVPAGDNGTGSYYFAYYVAYSNGNGYGAGIPLEISSHTMKAPSVTIPPAVTGDINGDGKKDLYVNIGYVASLLLLPSSPPDLLNKVTTGLGAATAMTYRTIADTSVYTKETTGVYPVRDLNTNMALYLVSSVSSSNGIGENYVSNYSYVGAKSHITGGGFLGFRQTINTDAQGIKSTTTYRQDYPYQGLPLTAEKRTSSGVLLNSVANTWTATTNPAWSPQYHASQIGQSVESSYELTGGLISTVTTSSVYDAYGNPTSITVSTPDGYSKTTVNTYDSTPTTLANWYLGRLINATVSSTAP
ncbi:MAG: toxin TcdB middle/N-terminal domain-containing protein [Gallionella sp.]|nr:toxin TcdB middle/N-terminal domain-containing protein [Gallionella sp.]